MAKTLTTKGDSHVKGVEQVDNDPVEQEILHETHDIIHDQILVLDCNVVEECLADQVEGTRLWVQSPFL